MDHTIVLVLVYWKVTVVTIETLGKFRFHHPGRHPVHQCRRPKAVVPHRRILPKEKDAGKAFSVPLIPALIKQEMIMRRTCTIVHRLQPVFAPNRPTLSITIAKDKNLLPRHRHLYNSSPVNVPTVSWEMERLVVLASINHHNQRSCLMELHPLRRQSRTIFIVDAPNPRSMRVAVFPRVRVSTKFVPFRHRQIINPCAHVGQAMSNTTSTDVST